MPELEHLADFDAAERCVGALAAARQASPFARQAQIVEPLELLEVAIGLEAEVVVALLVRAARQVVGAFEAPVRIHRHVELDRADEPGLGAGAALGLFERHELERVRADEVLQLHGVRLVIAPQHQPDVPSSPTSPFVAR